MGRAKSPTLWLAGIACVALASCLLDFEKYEATTTASGGTGGATSSTGGQGGNTSSSGGTGGMGGSTSSSGGGSPVDDCMTQYGDVTGFSHCSENALVCEFVANADTDSCQALCEARGGECLDAYTEQGQCGQGAQQGCMATGVSNMLCVCSHGCGGDPACTGNQTCVNSNCQ